MQKALLPTLDSVSQKAKMELREHLEFISRHSDSVLRGEPCCLFVFSRTSAMTIDDNIRVCELPITRFNGHMVRRAFLPTVSEFTHLPRGGALTPRRVPRQPPDVGGGFHTAETLTPSRSILLLFSRRELQAEIPLRLLLSVVPPALGVWVGNGFLGPSCSAPDRSWAAPPGST